MAGQAGMRYFQAKAKTLTMVADRLSTTTAKVFERVTKMQKQMKQLESRVQALEDTPLGSGFIHGVGSAPRVELHALNLPGGIDIPKLLKRRVEFLADQAAPDMVLLVMLGSQVACIANAKSNVHACKLMQQVMKTFGGNGPMSCVNWTAMRGNMVPRYGSNAAHCADQAIFVAMRGNDRSTSVKTEHPTVCLL
ncbi:hypothetical protein PsorP6_001735 [Peronosclerospora sorghi]|uniref:Uncharacterized protein n=1 Tax=Peronosclerospora sorghi TaxID=230839 RepID=A0ACC0WWW8_9STRA|nr:hypothetical protein PsorP6_001735 [Peronosclerospora sorghi]